MHSRTIKFPLWEWFILGMVTIVTRLGMPGCDKESASYIPSSLVVPRWMAILRKPCLAFDGVELFIFKSLNGTVVRWRQISQVKP